MSTRSYIGIKHKDQSFTFVYCHFDGYLAYNGVLLQEKYNDLSKIKDLISRGDMSSLEPTIDKIKFYNNDDDEQTHYVNDSHLNNDLNSLFDIEFFYYFDESSSKWFYAEHNSSSLTFKPLETAIKPEMLESMAKYLKRS